jgi:hypothetical protein
MISQQEMGPAERVADHVNGESSSIQRLPEFPKGPFHRSNVIQQDGDQAILVFFPVCPASFDGFAVTRQRRIECRSPAMIKTHGMYGYVLAILPHIRSHLIPVRIQTDTFVSFATLQFDVLKSTVSSLLACFRGLSLKPSASPYWKSA